MNEIFENINEKFWIYFHNTFDHVEMRTPQLLRCGFEQAFRNTLANGPVKMKPFFIYLHDNNQENHETFFMENICNEIICDYLLTESWPIWPIDVSDDNDKSSFFDFIRKRLDSTISIGKSQLPMMMMFVREGIKIIEAVHLCSKDVMNIVEQLFHHGGLFKIEKDMRVQMMESKRDQHQFNKLQKELALEKQRQEQQRIQQKRLEEIHRNQQAQQKLQAELHRQNQIEFAKSQLKQISPSPTNFIFRFRLPDGQIVMREFSDSQTINDCLYFVESNGYLRSEIKVLFSYPSKNMCEIIDINQNFKQAGASKREMINVHNI